MSGNTPKGRGNDQKENEAALASFGHDSTVHNATPNQTRRVHFESTLDDESRPDIAIDDVNILPSSDISSSHQGMLSFDHGVQRSSPLRGDFPDSSMSDFSVPPLITPLGRPEDESIDMIETQTPNLLTDISNFPRGSSLPYSRPFKQPVRRRSGPARNVGPNYEAATKIKDKKIQELGISVSKLSKQLHIYESYFKDSSPSDIAEVFTENARLRDMILHKDNRISELQEDMTGSNFRETDYNRLVETNEFLEGVHKEHEEMIVLRNRIIGILTDKTAEEVHAIALEDDAIEVFQRAVQSMKDEAEYRALELEDKLESQDLAFQKSLKESTDSRQKVETELAVETARAKGLEERLSSQQSSLSLAEARIKELQIQIETKSAMADMASQRADAERSTAQTTTDGLQGLTEKLRLQLQAKETELQTLRSATYNAQSQLADLRSQLESQQSREVRANARHDSLQAAYDALKTDGEKLALEAKSCQQLLTQSQEEVNAQKQRLFKLESELNAHVKDKEVQADKLKELKKELTKTGRAKSDTEHEFGEKNNTLQNQITNLTLRLAELQSKYEKAAKALRIAEDAHHDSVKVNKHQEQALGESQASLLSAQNKIRLLEGERAYLQNQLEITTAAIKLPQTRTTQDANNEQKLASQLSSLRTELEEQRLLWRHANDDLVRERTTAVEKVARLEALLKQVSEQEHHRLYESSLRSNGVGNDNLQRERVLYEARLEELGRELNAMRVAFDERNQLLNQERELSTKNHKEFVQSQLEIQRLKDVLLRAETLIKEHETTISALQESLQHASKQLKTYTSQINEANEARSAAEKQAQKTAFDLEEFKSTSQADLKSIKSDAEAAIEEAKRASEKTLRESIASKEEMLKTLGKSLAELREQAQEAAERASKAETLLATKSRELNTKSDATVAEYTKAMSRLRKQVESLTKSLDLVLNYNHQKDERELSVREDLVFFKDFARLYIERWQPRKRTFAGAATAVLAAIRVQRFARPEVSPKLRKHYNNLMKA